MTPPILPPLYLELTTEQMFFEQQVKLFVSGVPRDELEKMFISVVLQLQTTQNAVKSLLRAPSETWESGVEKWKEPM